MPTRAQKQTLSQQWMDQAIQKPLITSLIITLKLLLKWIDSIFEMEWVCMLTHYHKGYFFINFFKNHYQNKIKLISNLNGCLATPIQPPPELIKRYP